MSPAGFVLFLLSLPAIQAQEVSYTSTQVCAPKGSTVDLKCSYADPPGGNPPERPSWFRPGSNGGLVDLRTDPEYSGRVQYRNDGEDCTLRITDLRESDAAVYSFRSKTQNPGGRPAGPPGVTLSVTDLQVRSVLHLVCQSPGCPDPGPPSYVWYKNGEEVSETTSSVWFHHSWKDSFSCALKGFEDLPSPPLCVNEHELCFNKVTYDARNICAVKGSSVNIYSRYHSSRHDNYKFTSQSWFRSDRRSKDLSEDTHYEGRVEVISDDDNTNSKLRITDLRLNDSAEYRFTFATTEPFEWGRSLVGTRLTVTDLHVKISSYSSSSSSNWLNLECTSSCRLPEGSSFVWFKNGSFFEETASSSLQGSFGPADIISCTVRGLEDFPSPPLYGPRSPSVSLSPSGGLVEGTSVTLSCSSDANPAANYTWYKEDLLLSEGPALVFRSIQFSDSGLYRCIAKNQLGTRTSEPVSVTVEYNPLKIMNIIKLCLVPLTPVLLLLFNLWLRRKYPLSSIPEAGGRSESVEIHSRRLPSPQAEEDKDYELVE